MAASVTMSCTTCAVLRKARALGQSLTQPSETPRGRRCSSWEELRLDSLNRQHAVGERSRTNCTTGARSGPTRLFPRLPAVFVFPSIYGTHCCYDQMSARLGLSLRQNRKTNGSLFCFLGGSKVTKTLGGRMDVSWRRTQKTDSVTSSFRKTHRKQEISTYSTFRLMRSTDVEVCVLN